MHRTYRVRNKLTILILVKLTKSLNNQRKKKRELSELFTEEAKQKE
jgi:hypothetical protein